MGKVLSFDSDERVLFCANGRNVERNPMQRERQIDRRKGRLAHRATCGNSPGRVNVCLMKFRFDLASKVTPDMVLEEALANQHRYTAEPLLSQTGTGSLLSASTSDYAAEVERSTARIQQLMRTVSENGPQDESPNEPSLKR